MPEKHDLSSSLRKISSDGTKTNIIQNASHAYIEWTTDQGSSHYYSLKPGGYLKVNYDVWVKNDTHGVSHLVAGTYPPLITHTYRTNVVKNKTYVQTKDDVANLSNTLAVMAEFPELTIQKQKNIKLMIRMPAITLSNGFGGITVQTSVKVNGVDRILCDSDRVTCQTSSGRMAQAYNKMYVLDLIQDGIVAAADANAPYTLQVKLSAQTMLGASRVSATGTDINSASISTHGTLLVNARKQNTIGIIVEEFDR